MKMLVKDAVKEVTGAVLTRFESSTTAQKHQFRFFHRTSIIMMSQSWSANPSSFLPA